MRQTVHFLGWTENTSILGQNVAVINCRMGRNVDGTKCWRMDVSSRHLDWADRKDILESSIFVLPMTYIENFHFMLLIGLSKLSALYLVKQNKMGSGFFRRKGCWAGSLDPISCATFLTVVGSPFPLPLDCRTAGPLYCWTVAVVC